MSYEGYREFLCANGHHSCVDCYSSDPTVCHRCGAPMAFWNSVDLTNGQDEEYAYTMPAEKVETGKFPVIVYVSTYAPAEGSRWRPVPPTSPSP